MTATTWLQPEHTRAKHLLLQSYLRAWFPILGQHHRRIIFLDGFAGPGVYEKGEQGSPLVALDTLVNHSYFVNLSATEFVFIFIEPDESRCSSLSRSISNYWEHRGIAQPENIRIHIVQGEFAEIASRLAEIGNNRMAPTLAFVDPFGFSGVPMKVIGELLSSERCEVIFNFMLEYVNRFVNDKRSGIANHFVDLFAVGNDEHRMAGTLRGNARRDFLRNLYIHQLQEVAQFNYVRAFEVMNVARNRTAYYLIYGTRSLKGLEVMKDAMWAVDPINGVRFAGFAGDEPMLFDLGANMQPLRDALLTEFATRAVTIDEVEQFVIAETDYRRGQYKEVLRGLESEGRMRCLSARNRERTFPAGAVLEFLDRPERPSLFDTH